MLTFALPGRHEQREIRWSFVFARFSRVSLPGRGERTAPRGFTRGKGRKLPGGVITLNSLYRQIAGNELGLDPTLVFLKLRINKAAVNLDVGDDIP